jgi:hypothetical protein
MLLKAWEKHEQMSTKGEKQGFSGSIEHWMACKVLKRKEYYLDSGMNQPYFLRLSKLPSRTLRSKASYRKGREIPQSSQTNEEGRKQKA